MVMAATTGQEGDTRVSWLSQPLHKILTHSPTSPLLDSFRHFLGSVNALPVVQFWYSVQTFKSSPPNRGHPDSHLDPGAEVCQDTKTASLVCASCGLGPTEAAGVTHTHHKWQHGCYHDSEEDCADVGGKQCLCNVGTDISRGLTGSWLPVGGEECVKSNTGTEDNTGELSGKKDQNLPNFLQLESTDAKRKPPTCIVSSAIGIYTTYIALNAVSPVGIPDAVRQKIEVDICPEDGAVDSGCFDEAQAFVFATMEKRYYHEFLRSTYLCKYQLEHIASGNLTLLDFLLDQNTLFYFMEYMEQEGASSLLQFWLTAENFHAHMCSPSRRPDIEADTADAIVIYDRYFSLQASEPLGLGERVRIDVENRICDESGPRPDSFSAAQQMAYQTMSQHLYPHFLESTVYLRFVDELLHMLQTTDSRRPSTVAASEAGSVELPPCYDLDDPDSLWQRPRLPMRLGCVDEFGQYTSEIEPCPPKSGKHQGPTKRRGWWRAQRVDEDLAMKIARATVMDVLDTLTCSQPT